MAFIPISLNFCRLFTFCLVSIGRIEILAENTFNYTSYQTSIMCSPSSEIQTPGDTLALAFIVNQAMKEGKTMKAFGPRHSITDIICTNGIPISMNQINYTRVNSDGTATFGGGITLQAAMEFLESQGLSLIHVPTFGGISIAGAIGTGAHGSSLRHPTSLSDQVVRMNVIVGNGSLVEISGPELDYFRVHLGLLGIIVDGTFTTVPLFKMTIENRATNDAGLFDGSIVAKASDYDMYQLWWFPQSSNVVVGIGNYTSIEGEGTAYSNFIPNENVDLITASSKVFEHLQNTRQTSALEGFANVAERSLYSLVIGKPPIYTQNGCRVRNPATGYAWRLQSNLCETKKKSACSWDNGQDSVFPEESSMAFDIWEFTGVMTMLQSIIKRYPAAFALVGVYIRFSKASPATMAISTGRTTFTVEWATPMRQDPFNTSKDGIATYQAILQSMVFNHGGRPHWGKNGLYYTTQNILSRAVPNRQAFIDAMKTYDPKGIFLNDFGRRLLGLSDDQDRDPRVTRCALQDYCVCSSAADCGPYQHCGQIDGFPVCMDDSNLLGAVSAPTPQYVFPDYNNWPEMLNIVLATIGKALPIKLISSAWL